jgi:DNA primase
VGHTSRYLDDRKPKYISEQQRGYVFNMDNQQSNWQICILVEGQFDAISIGGCAYMGQNILDEQAELLKRLQRRIIVVPDRDSAGMSVCDRALELGYSVSMPDWCDQVKDVNDAIKRYGRLPTLLSIIHAATSSKIKIEMLKKRYR